MNNHLKKILVVDNDKSIVWVLEKALTDEGFSVDTVFDGRQGVEKLSQGGYSAAIMDIRMPVMDGLTALGRIRALPDPPEVIIMTAHSNMENTVEAMKLGAFDYIVKPFDIDQVIDLAGRAIRKFESRRVIELPVSRDSSHNIIGNTPTMRELYKILGRVASTDTSVLITGETGTGKDLIARSIHYHSTRRNGPFIVVNCASIPAELLESELFGHVKGAFTGATAHREGKCEAADKGTLFLDEIGTMRLDLQAKLLRFLQNSEFERVGSSETMKVDVRVIAATNADLKKMVESGQFREDLYYRLMVVPLHIPSLRERKDDIPSLARHFVERFNAKYNLSFVLSDELIATLKAKDWPGNVRELENYLHRLVVLQSDSLGAVGNISPNISSADQGRGIDAIVDELLDQGKGDLLEAARARIEKPLLTKLMDRLSGNQSEAAKILGVSRNTLRKMLAEYGLDAR